jgi:hypothetical protein
VDLEQKNHYPDRQTCFWYLILERGERKIAHHKVLIGLLLVVGLAVAAGSYYSAQYYKQANASQNALEASYQSNFFNLIETLENLDVLLGKSLVPTPQGRTRSPLPASGQWPKWPRPI